MLSVLMEQSTRLIWGAIAGAAGAHATSGKAVSKADSAHLQRLGWGAAYGVAVNLIAIALAEAWKRMPESVTGGVTGLLSKIWTPISGAYLALPAAAQMGIPVVAVAVVVAYLGYNWYTSESGPKIDPNRTRI